MINPSSPGLGATPLPSYDARMEGSDVDPPVVAFQEGEHRPALGLGTWRFGEQRSNRAAEVRTLRVALEIGWRVIDTAEMYGEGGAEQVVGEAVAAALRGGLAREALFVVSKVYPHNASAEGVLAAFERSRRRLQLDCIDLYLLHWRGGIPLAETVRGFQSLRERGLIRHWGVSNFDVGDLGELDAVPGGAACAANQVCYSLGERGVEFELVPWQRRRGMPLMAYSPLDQGALAGHPALSALAEEAGVTPAQLALAWVLRQPGVMAIPKAGNEAHLRENLAAASMRLADSTLAALDRLFPPPRRRLPLAMR
jgi:diketogulonate reductase-like aldo/keto reductase